MPRSSRPRPRRRHDRVPPRPYSGLWRGNGTRPITPHQPASSSWADFLAEYPDAVCEVVYRNLVIDPATATARLSRLAATLRRLAPDAELGEWTNAVLAWWRFARPVCPDLTFDEVLAHFVLTFDSCDPRSECWVKEQLRQFVDADAPPLDNLQAVLVGLGRMFGPTVYLSCRFAAAVLGCGWTKAWGCLRQLEDSGELKVIERGVPGEFNRKATVYDVSRLLRAAEPVPDPPEESVLERLESLPVLAVTTGGAILCPPLRVCRRRLGLGGRGRPRRRVVRVRSGGRSPPSGRFKVGVRSNRAGRAAGRLAGPCTGVHGVCEFSFTMRSDA